jgi:hypothetical protein
MTITKIFSIKSQTRVVTLTPADEELASHLSLPIWATGASTHQTKTSPHTLTIGSYGHPNLDALLHLTKGKNKDVVVLAGEGTPSVTIDQLEYLGFQVHHSRGLSPLQMATQTEDLAAISRDPSVLSLLQQKKRQLLSMQNSQTKKKVLVIVQVTPLIVACSETPLARLLKWQGYENACPAFSKGYRTLSPEFLSSLQPGTLVLTPHQLPNHLLTFFHLKKIRFQVIDPNVFFRISYVQFSKIFETLTHSSFLSSRAMDSFFAEYSLFGLARKLLRAKWLSNVRSSSELG